MRRHEWLTLSLVLATAVAAAPVENGTGKSYKTLGNLAVMHEGRVKPLDTVAIEEVKQIYGRSTIKLLSSDGKVAATWAPVAAILDWSVRPDFWNNQEFILVEYLPLKRLLLASATRNQVKALTAKAPEAVRSVLTKLAAHSEINASDLKAAARRAGLTTELGKDLERLARKLGEDQKWLSPRDLEEAQVTQNGKTQSFTQWFGEILGKNSRARRGTMGASSKLPVLEEKVSEVGQRLIHYVGIRDHNERAIESLDKLVIPRPSDAVYLKYSADAFKKAKEQQSYDVLNPLELNAATTLSAYWEDLQGKDRALPGEDSKFDQRFTAWLRTGAPWIPLRLVLDSEPAELARAGFSSARVASFRDAYHALEDAERDAPGNLAESKAQALISAARELGSSVGTYPPAAEMTRESHFNSFAPFYKAPMAYGFAVVLLLLSLAITADPESTVAKLANGMYRLGMVGFVTGIILEAYGFYLRVSITGWAPVTNMYETVIWVALIASVIGLVLELISRKKYPALAASGVALLATVLAANVSLLDPNIHALQPVLRSNYWLTIHVLTIVSSYAAFALALGLGLLAIGYYLTTSYRRSASYRELAWPLLPGVPLYVIGRVGIYTSFRASALLDAEILYYVGAALAAIGGIMAIVGGFSALGELANRQPRHTGIIGLVLLFVGSLSLAAGMISNVGEPLASLLTSYDMWLVALVGAAVSVMSLFGAQAQYTMSAALDQMQVLDETALAGAASVPSLATAAAGGGGVATLTRPSVAEIRARVSSHRPKNDARTIAMQTTAARIKPLANFVYRAMQVGVLLVAAGTILGGVWADYSWGRFWGWDPKEVWALITLLVYLVPLHGRFAGWVNTFGLVAASVVCFMSVLMAWYGVNFVLGVGLHSYGFTEGGGQGIVMSCTLAVLAVVGAAAWRRWLSMRPEASLAV
jgi:ABC-type transport system involved in cytochrome c biogenesis permease subunit